MGLILKKIGTKEIAVSSMLGALVFILEYFPLDIKFPLYTRITWDPSGIPVMTSLIFFGPLSAIYTCLVGYFILFFKSMSSGLFKIVAELSTLLGYAFIGKNIILKTSSATISRVIVMTVMNYYMLPFFYKMPVSFVVGILPVLAIFNITQALINIIPAQIIHNRLKTLV